MEKTLVTTIKVLLALSLAMPFVVMRGSLPEALYPYILGKALYFRLAVEIAFAAWLFLLIRFPEYRLPRSWLLLAIVAYLVVALAASFAGVSITRSIWSSYERMQGWVSLAHYTAFALMLASVLRTFRHWQGFLNINLLASFGVGLLGIYTIATGSEPRLSVTFGNPSFLATYVLINAFIAAAFLAHSLGAPREQPTRRSRSRARRNSSNMLSRTLMRSFWVAVLCLNLLALNYTGTRGATVGLIAGIVCVLVGCVVWGERRYLRLACVSTLIGILALGAATLLLIGSPILDRLGQFSPTLQRAMDITPETFSLRSRIDSAEIGLEAFGAKPLLGWGPENYYAAYDRYIDGKAVLNLERFDQAHNRIVEELVTTGVIGLATYLALWLCLGWLFITKTRRLPLDGRLFTIVIGGAFVAYFVQNLFLFDTPTAAVQIYLLIGFAIYLGSVPAASAFDAKWTPQAAIRPHEGVIRRIETAVTGTTVSQVAVAAVIAVPALWLCYLLVVAPYIGATNTFAALTGDRTAEERFSAYDTAVSTSPGYANETVRLFINFVIDHRESLSFDERATAIEMTRRDVAVGLQREPLEWRFHLSMAQLYNRESGRSPELVRLARQHTDAAAAIAPGRIEVLQLKVQQYIYEGNAEAAINLIDRYFEESEHFLEKDSAVYRRLDKMRKLIVEGQ